MIIFNRLYKKDNIPYISFKNEDNEVVDVPIDEITSKRISRYLSKISKPAFVEKESSDEE